MNKYKIFTLSFLFFTILSMDFVSAKINIPLELFGKVIYLDAGHGGLDPGALYKNIQEKDINLKIAKKIQDKLESKGAIVYQTRYGDYDLSVKNTNSRKRSDLSRRVSIINNSNADLYLSIHLNSDASSSWKGIQLFYDDINPNNKELANIMEKGLKQKTSIVRPSKRVSNLYMLRKITVPGLLIEAGFLSNPNDRYLLKQESYQNQLAELVTESVNSYFLNQ